MPSEAPQLSVVICTYNPRTDYLDRCLDALKRQTLRADRWELLVIDNACDVPLAPRLDLGWHGGARIVREDVLGLTPARLRGIQDAKAELLVFVDDDNALLAADYLEVALRVAAEKRFLGSWSGNCEPGPGGGGAAEWGRESVTPKVLHIVDNLHRGSIEAWLLRMMAHAQTRELELDWTFYCTVTDRGAKDDEARALGARVVYSPAPLTWKSPFTGALRRELQCGKYQVLHCHHDLVSAIFLAAATGLNIDRRVVHVHNADETVPTPSLLKRATLRPVLRRICLAAADRIVGNSNHSLDTFLQGRGRRAGRDFVHYLGVDAAPFETAKGDRVALRRRLGLPDDARIMIFFGRMTPEKNPVFAVDVLASLRCLAPDVVGLFVGSGSLEAEARGRAAELGLQDSVRFLGWSDDGPEILTCSDLFILPHPEAPMEGFGVAVVEAQLAGLRLLLSLGVADDPLLPNAKFRRLPLSAGPDVWARAALELMEHVACGRRDAIEALGTSRMDMDRALDDLLSLYA